MGKKYNLSSSSDMRRFSRDLEKTIMDKALNAVDTMDFNIACPHCNSMVSMHSGLNICPFCHNEVNVELNTNF